MVSTQVTHRPCVLIIRDGWGENPYPERDHANAVKVANPPVDTMLRREWPFTLIATSGLDVGLPEGTMGNGEVGHHNIGAGRVVYQESVRITKTIRDGKFSQNQALVDAVQHALAHGTALHLLGLASDAGVHSRLEHLFACVELAKQRGLDRVYVHCFTDGRDSPPTSGVHFVKQIEGELRRIGVGRIASICGRYWAMDRDGRWKRTEKAYRMLVYGEAAVAASAVEALERYYANPVEPTMRGDEFVVPTVVSEDGSTPVATIRDGDSVVFWNYRGDRPRQLTEAFTFVDFPFLVQDRSGIERLMGFNRGRRLDLFYVTMTSCQGNLPVEVAFPLPPRMENTAGPYLSRLGLRQFRCAETEKYAHVTFFFNDYREEPFWGEERHLVPSPRVATYDQAPAMSAREVTKAIVRRIDSALDDLIVVNYANGDMVGHTGSLEAAVEACEVVDDCVGEVLKAVRRVGGCAIITADHGNFEQMIDPETGGPHTSHTMYLVPFYVFGAAFRGAKLREGGKLADVMPTALAMLGLKVPDEMTGEPLFSSYPGQHP